MLPYDHLNQLLSDIKEEFPGFKTVDKSDSKLMKVIDLFLKIITFGNMKQFITSYTTTIGSTIYLSENHHLTTTTQQIALFSHERVHMRQEKKYGKLLYTFLYLFFPIPFFFAYGRTFLEREAYAETLKIYSMYYGLEHLLKDKVKQNIINHFVSSSYLWMWYNKKSCEEWYDKTIESIKLRQV